MGSIQISAGQKKYIALIAGLTVLGIFFLSFGGETPADTNNYSAEAVVSNSNSDDKEKKLAEILSQVEGAGKVAVQINYSSAGETSYATNEKRRTQNTQGTINEEEEETIAFYNNQGSEAALVLEKKEPVVAGILIVAQGADDAQIKRDLTTAAAVLFDLPEYKITVLKMKGGEIE